MQMHNLLKGGNSREASTNCFDFGKTTLLKMEANIAERVPVIFVDMIL